MSAPEGWQADMRLRQLLEERVEARTPDGTAREAMTYIVDLCVSHERHFPGRPRLALQNVVAVGVAHLSEVEAIAEGRGESCLVRGEPVHVSEALGRVVITVAKVRDSER